MNKIYDISFSKLAQWLIPADIRAAVITQWLLALIAPIVTVYQAFLRYRTDKLYQLMITPQVCYLERLLNDKYDFVNRGIYIDDPIQKLPTYLYLAAELKSVHLYLQSEDEPVYLFTDGEAGEYQDDFIIMVPAIIKFSEAEMLTLVKQYRLAGMKPKIQRY